MGACTLTLAWSFLTAYFNGYQVLLTINDYGEAHAELVLLLLGIPCGFYYARRTLYPLLDNLWGWDGRAGLNLKTPTDIEDDYVNSSLASSVYKTR